MASSALGTGEGMAADIGIFSVAEQRLEWLEQRQSLLAQNIANADTPNYATRDLAPFAAMLGQFDVAPTRTNPLHLAGLRSRGTATEPRPYERSPDGNTVSIEQQMTKVADDEGSQALVGNLWKSYMGMFMTALGHGS